MAKELTLKLTITRGWATVAFLVIAAACVILLWVAWAVWGAAFVAYRWRGSYGPATLAELGQVGDLFGGINSLFAALAFVGVAFAAVYQGRSLNVQLKAAQDAQDQLHLARDAHVQQSFEPLFFRLLELHREVAATMKFLVLPASWPLPHSVPLASGARGYTVPTVIAELTTQLANRWGQIVRLDKDARAQAQLVAQSYDELYVENEAKLGPYFRSLYQIFKLIANSTVSYASKVRYANVARSTLSKDDIFLLLLNCASDRGQDFKPYVEGFGLLKHLAASDAVAIGIAERLYAASAREASRERHRRWHAAPNEAPSWVDIGHIRFLATLAMKREQLSKSEPPPL